jgi:hypothetical protein
MMGEAGCRQGSRGGGPVDTPRRTVPHQRSTNPQGYLPRDQRFPVKLRVRYRKSGAVRWSEGITENVSDTGMLFRAPKILQPKAAIEGRLVLPVVIPGESSAELVFRGVVVRTAPAAMECAHPTLAVSLVDYRLVRRGQTPVTGSASRV